MLQKRIDRRTKKYGHFPTFDEKQSVVLFRFMRWTKPDGIAAKIWSFSDPALNSLEEEAQITQAKWDLENHDLNSTASSRLSPMFADLEYLEKLISLGHGTEEVIRAEETITGLPGLYIADHPSITGVEEYQYTQNITENNNMPGRLAGSSINANASIQPISGLSSETQSSPLFRGASDQDIKDARRIVDAAVILSSRINAARLANPLRKAYAHFPNSGLPRSIDKRYFAANRTKAESRLHISNEVALAAALVAEADSVEMVRKNMTRRAVTVTHSGSFWMGNIARKGTVPWGNDSGYKVFRNVLEHGAVGDGVTVSVSVLDTIAHPKYRWQSC
jgi:hypothetical protein